MTLREKFTKALLSYGWTRFYPSQGSKYHVFSHPEKPFKVYLGSSGALRMGQSQSSSVPAPETLKASLIARSRQRV